jgi:hypothetical protein
VCYAICIDGITTIVSLFLRLSVPKRAPSPEATAQPSGANKSSYKEVSKSVSAIAGGKHAAANTLEESWRSSDPKTEIRGEAAASIITGGLFRNKYRMAGTHDPRKVPTEIVVCYEIRIMIV